MTETKIEPTAEQIATELAAIPPDAVCRLYPTYSDSGPVATARRIATTKMEIAAARGEEQR